MNYYQYQKRKERLRQEAIYHQRQASELNLAWWDICEYQEYLKTEAKKYGLIKEFKENGII